ncbi:MAG TPA: VWA domain-containing protein [Bryobacteraceae bacterium]|nr:VWA domain-containing protein [Bryobacteraceae bacterium]
MGISFPYRLTRILAVAVSLLAVRGSTAAASERLGEDRRQSTLVRAEVDLVVVPVMVTDRQGKTVTGLAMSAFTVFEQGTLQQVASLNTEDAPCSIGIVLDTSGSMKGVAARVRRSIRAFLDTLHPDDEVSLLTVSDRPRLRLDFTSEISRADSGLLFSKFAGSTPLVDSVRFALQHMRHASHGRRALLIVSDGQDNSSRFSKRELMELAIETDVQIYSIGIAETPMSKQQSAQNWRGITLLEDLSQATGGLHSVVRGFVDLEPTAARFGRAMHDQYVITYYSPKHPDEGKWRKLEVKVIDPAGQQVRIFARRRYFVPSRQHTNNHD